MKYCKAFPCNQVAVNGAYCPEHTPARAPKQTDPFYLSVRWRRFRNWYIKQHPFCEHCIADDRLEASVIVDHVIEIKDGGAPLDESNVQALCRLCHAHKTSNEAVRRKIAKNHHEYQIYNRRVSAKQS